jgi:hypothetical protein
MAYQIEVPELLENYMESSGMQECWVTVRDFAVILLSMNQQGRLSRAFCKEFTTDTFFPSDIK